MSKRAHESEPVLQLVGVTKEYDAPDGSQRQVVLDGIDLVVECGQTVAITGPSGSGKSTLLNIMGTLDRASSGRVLIDGREVGCMSDDEQTGLRNRRIGFVFQSHHLLPQCTALENTLVPTVVSNDATWRRAAPEQARRLLERVGLRDHTHHRPGQLSGGQCQRVAVVRALINRPALLLADEPTGALDRPAAESLAQLLLELNQEEHTTLVVASHAASLVSKMQRVLGLEEGKLHVAGNVS